MPHDQSTPPLSHPKFRAISKAFQKNCPRSWAMIASKRYILPNYRQADYFNQDYCDQLLSDFILSYHSGTWVRPDAVLNCQYMNAAVGLHYGRPMYFLESELGIPLSRTRLPLDLIASDIKWRHLQLRIMLPKGLLGVERDGSFQSIIYLDIVKVDHKQEMRLPPVCEKEIELYIIKNQLRRSDFNTRPFASVDGLAISAQLESPIKDAVGPLYGSMKPWNDQRIREILAGEYQKYETSVVTDLLDDRLLASCEHLAINLLIFMGSVPTEYAPAELQALRKARLDGSHLLPGRYRAKFVGKSQYRPSNHNPQHGPPTGRHLMHHWRSGHWKRQPCGPKSGDRKLIWLLPYEVGQEEHANA
jgi:hypothetical protein